MNWDIFISHASEDKKTVAEPLVTALTDAGLRVWFDRFQLRLGDRLLRSINEGLKQSRFGAVVLSPSFFAKHWPLQELDGLAQREEDGQKVILPIWHHVTVKEVREHSPLLADRIAAKWSDGLSAVAQQILDVVVPGAQAEEDREASIIGAVLRIRQKTRFLWQELTKHINDPSPFSARIRSDTLKAIETDLILLRERAGLEYTIAHVGFDIDGGHFNEITIKATSPVLWRAVSKAIAFNRQADAV